MTTAKTDTAVVTGVTEEQLTALVEGQWQDDDDLDTPRWERAVVVGGEDMWMFQWIFPFIAADGSGVRWTANSGGTHSGNEHVFVNSLDEALSWCDERAGDRKPAAAGSVTKQENRFAELAAGG